jgi:hypothetical protein
MSGRVFLAIFLVDLDSSLLAKNVCNSGEESLPGPGNVGRIEDLLLKGQ